MSKNLIRVCAGLLILGISLTGCGSKTSAPAGSNSAATEPGGAAGPYDPSQIPETADAAVRTVIEGVRQKHPEALWHFLPASFQQDINDLVHEFANRMDPELWSKATALIGKLGRVIREKKELLGATMSPPQRPGAPVQPVNYEGVAKLLETLVRSDLGNLEKLRTADAGKILAVTGGQLLEQLQLLSRFGQQEPGGLPLDELLRLKIELKSAEGDAALVLVHAPNEPPRETEFVRVEGKWIPRSLSEGWIETIGLAKARLSILSRETLAEQKPRWMTLIASFDEALGQLAAAKTRDEFAAAGSGLYLPAMMLAGMLQTQPVDADDMPDGEEEESIPEASAKDLVTIVVRGKLDAGAQNDLLDRFRATLGRGKVAFAEFTGDEESTTFRIGPVPDLDEFSAKLDFLEQLEADANSRTIRANATSGN